MSRRKVRQKPPHDALEKVRRLAAAHRDEDPRILRARMACHKYEMKLRRGQGNPRTDGMLDEQVERYTRAACWAAQTRVRVRQLLCTMGVDQCLVFSYLAFSQHVDRLARSFAGRSLGRCAGGAVGRWTARGLDPVVLEALCIQVFDIEPEAGPE